VIWRSFRFRLVLLFGVLAAIVLIGFAGAAWTIARQSTLRGFDGEIANRLVPRALRETETRSAAAVEAELHQELDGTGPNRVALLLRDPDGKILYQSPDWPGDPATLPPPVKANRPPPPQGDPGERRPPLDGRPPPPFGGPDGRPPPPFGRPDGRPPPPPPALLPNRGPPPVHLASLQDDAGHHWRAGFAARPEFEIGLAVSEGYVGAELAPLATGFLIGVPVALLLAALGAWLISGQVLRPVRRLAASIDAITAQGLENRVSLIGEPEEIERLVQAFNAMLERLDRSFRQASRFSGDAAHELKTPLAILQGEIERGLAEVLPGSSMQRRLSALLDEVRRLSAICRKLLLLSLADAGKLPLTIEPFALDEALDELAEDIQALAPGLALTVTVPRGLQVPADAQLLRQALQNLASNAIKYTLPEGWIRIEARRTGEQVRIAVANASPGIPQDARERIFDRFFRADTAHGRHVDGVGLGLGLAREILRAHGGELALLSSPEGEVRFEVTLPG